MNIAQTVLSQLDTQVFITDGGLETVMCFHENIELPEFAAYNMLKTETQYDTLYRYYREFAVLAQKYGVGLLLDTPTWRCSADWGVKLVDSPEQLDTLNRKGVRMLKHIREEFPDMPFINGGSIGPRGDGYRPENMMTAKAAEQYHSHQIKILAECDVDILTALTLNYIEEAVGICHAAKANNLPVCISFTVETDGKLPTGESLQGAIEAVDKATDNAPAYYMINCAHTTHFEHLLTGDQAWTKRIKGLQGNASCLSHAELDESEVLDDGNPQDFGEQYKILRNRNSQLNILGGCCGTDIRHIEQICQSAI